MAGNDNRTVLVVEDEIMVQMLVIDVLNDLGISTLQAKDAPSAFPILESEQNIDLMVTDIGLPGMSGWDLAKSAREIRPSMKILYLTGYESAETRSVERNGLQDVMAKPFDMGAFEARVLDMLNSSLQGSVV